MKRAVITGGTRGIGAAIARRLQHAGYELIIISKDDPKMPIVGAGYIDANFRFIEDVQYAAKKIAERWDKLDLLVNNAGIAKAVKIEDTDEFDLGAMMQVNAIAPFVLTKALLPLLKANGGGSVINISSISGLTGFSTMGAYCASKFALTGFGLVAAKEFAKYNIRVNNVCPGPTETDMWKQLDKEYRQINGWETDEQSEQAYMSKLLIKRMGNPEDVAAAVEFLADDNLSSYITGTNFKVCGGNLIG